MLHKKERRHRIRSGRQLEQARLGGFRSGAEGGHLTREEVDHFNLLVRSKLCASRESICEAMAICFEKSTSAEQVTHMLKECLLEDENICPGISVETRIARLYLLSDILFNSQQPGVRGAFRFRDAIEQMAPDVLASFGKHGIASGIGRMSKNKLASSVSSVLGAWANWGVYNPLFLDQVQARFEGREWIEESGNTADEKIDAEVPDHESNSDAKAAKVISASQRQEWQQVSDDPIRVERMDTIEKVEEEEPSSPGSNKRKADKMNDGSSIDGDSLDPEDTTNVDMSDLDGEALTEDDLYDSKWLDDIYNDQQLLLGCS
jgi:hypothetical protein